MLPGPPYAMTSTASGVLSSPMHEIHNRADRRDFGFGEHAVPEVEDVTRPAVGAPQHVADLPRALGRGSEERRGLEIPLDRMIANSGPRRVERNAPIDADHVSTSSREVLEKRRRARTEVNDRDAGLFRERQRRAAVRLHEGAVVVGREAPDPTIEQLQRLRAGTRLRREKPAYEIRQL